MRMLTLQEGYNRLEWTSTLHTSFWFAYRSAFPFKATVCTCPRLYGLISENCISHFSKKWRFFQGRCRCNFRDQLIVFFRVDGQASSVEQFVHKCVLVQCFIFEESWMKTDCDWARVKAQFSSTNQLVTSLIKPSHTQPIVRHFQPFQRESICDPGSEHCVDFSRKRLNDIFD